MRILLYGINFVPEPTGIGKYSGDMAAWLAAAGHEVRVITAPPYYPQWKVGQGYNAWRHAKERWKGVDVWRTPVWVPARPTGATRVLHLAQFCAAVHPHAGSAPVLAARCGVGGSTCVCLRAAGWLAARLCRAKAWLHVQDFEVDAAFRLGLLKGGVAQRIVTAIEHWMLQALRPRLDDLRRACWSACTSRVYSPTASCISPIGST